MFAGHLLLPKIPAKTIVLTYDDGPGPLTVEIAEFLRGQGVRATFFCVGRHVRRRSDVVRRVKQLGHLLGNHTDNHAILPELVSSPQQLIDAVRDADRDLAEFVGGDQCFLRPPQGLWSPQVAEVLNTCADLQKYIGPIAWDVNGLDWQIGSPRDLSPGNPTYTLEECQENYRQAILAKGSGVILLHDWCGDDGELGEQLRRNNRTLELTKWLVAQFRGFKFIGLDQIGSQDDEAFKAAVQHHQAGQLNQAEQIYRQILARQPSHAGALHYLGVIAHQVGRHDIAVELIEQALTVNPACAEAHSNQGEALKAQGDLDKAIAAYRQAIALNPHYPQAYSNLGNALRERGDLDQAIAACRQATALDPNWPDAYNNLGNALNDKGNVNEAVAAYRQAIALRPNYPAAQSNIGQALQAKGHFDQAIAACRQAIALNPNYAEAHSNLGNALQANGQLTEAIAAYRRAVAINPRYAEAFSNLGNVLQADGQLDEAIAVCRHAVALKPALAAAHSNLGCALKDNGQLDEAITACRQAIALKRDYPEALHNLANALQTKGQLDEAIAFYRKAIALKPTYAEACNNLGNTLRDKGLMAEAIAAYRQAVAIKPNDAAIHSNLVYSIYFLPDIDAKAIAREHDGWNQQHGLPLQKYIQPHTNNRDPQRRLRIGYVSPDFRNHVVALFLEPLLAHHDHQCVEVFAYPHVAIPDAMTLRMRGHTDAWRSLVGLTDAQAADLIRQDRIDILIDLTLHMANNRLLIFARKPAPVQVTWLGFPGSTGLTTIDYRLTDPYLDPPDRDESVYSEKTFRLPDSFWCYDPLFGRDVAVSPLPALTTGVVTFGCLNNFAKVHPGILTLWAQVMRQVAHSRLLLLAPEGDHRRRALDQLAQEGIASSRVEFVPRQSRRGYLEVYRRIDLGLDSFPVNGHSTSLDSYWMGVPVVTLVGPMTLGRAGWSQLSNLGMTELAAHTPEQFVQIAVDLANDLPRLQQIRSTLRPRMEASSLMDAPRFARNMEAAYRQMWHRWCASDNLPA